MRPICEFTMRQYLFISLFLLLTLSGFAQTAKQADDLFNAREYAEARAVYDALLRKQPTHPLYLYRAARCAQELGDLTAAEELFIKAGTKYPLRDFFLGEIYYQQWRMPEAIAAYEAFLPSINEEHERYPLVQQRIASANLIARYLKHVSRIEVLNVKRVPKTALLNAYRISEDNGILSLDSLGSSFTTQRGDRRYYSVSLTDTIDSLPVSRSLLVCQQRLLQNWEDPDTLRATVNSGTTNAYPFVLTDGATLYFASDREGGLGGLDIYMTRYNAALGQWLPAENIGMPFNSPADDYLYAVDEHDGFAFFATNRHCLAPTVDSTAVRLDSLPAQVDSVDVYQIALSERTFLRGLPDNELVALARLDSLIPLMSSNSQPFGEVPEIRTNVRGSRTIVETESNERAVYTSSSAPLSTASHASADSIFFVLNNDVTYTRLSDFHSDSARVLYEQYIRLEHMQSEAVEMLDSLRHQYFDADNTTRASLQARIPSLSNEIDERKRTLRQTLTQIRTLESAH